MSDLDLLIAGAMVTFLSVAGAYIAIRHRANEAPVDSYRELRERPRPEELRHTDDDAVQRSPQHAAADVGVR